MKAPPKSLRKGRMHSEALPIYPPPYSRRAPNPILKNNRHKRRRQERRAVAMFITQMEKWFLRLFTAFALLSLLFTFFAIFADKNGITGSEEYKSVCMLSDTHDCETEYTGNLPRYIVAVGVRVDLLLSCITFVTGVMLLSFKVFNCRILVGFLLVGTFKIIFMVCALLVILTNNNFYFDTVNAAFSGFCGQHFCVDEDRMNIVVAFILLLGSGLSSAFMMFTVFTIGSRILNKFEDEHYEATWAKWDAMTAELNAY